MRKALSIFVIASFLSVWFVPLSMGFADTHICEFTNTLCKNKEQCPLTEGHTHKKEDPHGNCNLTVYKSGDDVQPVAGSERPLQFCAGWLEGSPTPELVWFEPQTSLLVEEVSHTPPERPPQTG